MDQWWSMYINDHQWSSMYCTQLSGPPREDLQHLGPQPDPLYSLAENTRALIMSWLSGDTTLPLLHYIWVLWNQDKSHQITAIIEIMSGLPNDELLHESVLQELAIHVAQGKLCRRQKKNEQKWSNMDATLSKPRLINLYHFFTGLKCMPCALLPVCPSFSVPKFEQHRLLPSKKWTAGTSGGA